MVKRTSMNMTAMKTLKGGLGSTNSEQQKCWSPKVFIFTVYVCAIMLMTTKSILSKLLIPSIDVSDSAELVTETNKGKHHIGDFLPPEELEKFIEKVKAAKGEYDPGRCLFIEL